MWSSDEWVDWEDVVGQQEEEALLDIVFGNNEDNDGEE